ncbi:hypothetical protein AAVH_33310 [Aphelenchoides avenae]|nr:hypothetical protein AAVH_33310 [Aphelenchus avenae]
MGDGNWGFEQHGSRNSVANRNHSDEVVDYAQYDDLVSSFLLSHLNREVDVAEHVQMGGHVLVLAHIRCYHVSENVLRVVLRRSTIDDDY